MAKDRKFLNLDKTKTTTFQKQWEYHSWTANARLLLVLFVWSICKLCFIVYWNMSVQSRSIHLMIFYHFTRIWSFFVIAGSFSEWRGKLTRNFGFAIDLISLLMSLGHYSMIFWLRGMAFHLVDAVLLLNLRVSDLLLNNWIMSWRLHNIFYI